jgi:hypothetical protein
VAFLVLAAANVWEWRRHTADHNPIVAIVDGVFAVAALALFFYSLKK